jgi:hypothetical protein
VEASLLLLRSNFQLERTRIGLADATRRRPTTFARTRRAKPTRKTSGGDCATNLNSTSVEFGLRACQASVPATEALYISPAIPYVSKLRQDGNTRRDGEVASGCEVDV